MHDIFQIRIKLDHKLGMFLTIVELLSHGDLSSRQWWLHHQIIQKLLQFTKLVVNAYGLDRLSTIFKNHVGSHMSKTSQQYYLKTMLHALHKSNEVTSKEIEPNTFHQNFSIHMSFRIMVKLMSSKYDKVII